MTEIAVLWLTGMYFSFFVHKVVKGRWFEWCWWQDLLGVFLLWWFLLPIQIINLPCFEPKR